MSDTSLSKNIPLPAGMESTGWGLEDAGKNNVILSRCRVFFDFDNTISKIDVLDNLIETFAVDKQWRVLEQRWQAGEIGSEECIRGQFRSVRVTRRQLEAYLAEIDIDPYFHRTLVFLRNAGIRPVVLSDSFNFLIKEILKSNDVHGMRVLANHLKIRGDRLVPSFPYRNVGCLRCGNCKTARLCNEDNFGRVMVYVGDGRSDYCAAMQAHLVFAKDSLAAYLQEKGKKFVPFKDFQDVYKALKGLSHG